MKDVSIDRRQPDLPAADSATSGTLTASATITAALRDIAVKKVGYSGLMMPVSKTRGSRNSGAKALSRWISSRYSAVCGTGLDTSRAGGHHR